MLELRGRGRFAVEQDPVNAVVGGLRQFGVELVVAVLGHVEWDFQFRPFALGLEEDDVLGPEQVGHDGGLALLGLDLGHGILDLDLQGVALGQPRRAVGHGRLVLGDALLVPERDAGHQVRALAEGGLDGAVGIIGPALVLDVELERLGERDRVEQVPAVGRHPRAQVRAFGHRHAVIGAVVHVQAPGVIEVVLRAGPLDGRVRLAVHPEVVVALAEPACLGLDDRQHRADVVAPALYVEEFVRRPVGGRRQRLAVAGVEIQGVLAAATGTFSQSTW